MKNIIKKTEIVKPKIGDRILKIFERLFSVRSILTLGVFGTLMYQFITRIPIDPFLASIASALLTHWFGENILKNNFNRR